MCATPKWTNVNHLGLLLPCNAVVYQQGGRIHVGVVDAAKMLGNG